MRLPKKTKWVKKKNERPEGWQTCFGRPQGRGWCSCLLNGATLRTPDEWTGGGADISTVIYHPARPARKLAGPAAHSFVRSLVPYVDTGPQREERERKIEKEERQRKRDHERALPTALHSLFLSLLFFRAPRGPGPTLITTPPDFLVIIWWFQYRDRISSGIPTLTFQRDNHTRSLPVCAKSFPVKSPFFYTRHNALYIISRNYAHFTLRRIYH